MAGSFMILLFPSLATAIRLSPCGADGIRDVLPDQDTVFMCAGEGHIQWRLRTNGATLSLAVCREECIQPNTIEGFFTASTIDSYNTSMVIKVTNNSRLHDNIQFVNGSLECVHGDVDDELAGCGLNYVYPAEGIECTASRVSWSVTVSCAIQHVYSSRGIYKCQIFQCKDMLKNESLQTVTMLASPTMEKVTNTELKVSGVCQLNITLPAEEGNYDFWVVVFPGGREITAGHKGFAVERPRSATLSCRPRLYVLENTNITCICSTTSLGNPAGYLRWVTGNQEHQHQESPAVDRQVALSAQELQYSKTLTLSDHGQTWFRCDVVWGAKEIRGENVTANVGYAAKTPRFSIVGRENNQTVMEGQEVHFTCDSEGRPTPNVSIYNSDNETVMWRSLSPIINSFNARCEDTATYVCSAWNEFSSQSHITISPALKLDVRCTPRGISTTHLRKVNFRNKTEKVNFDVIAYPAPHDYGIWLVVTTVNSSEPSYWNVEGSEMNVTCKVYRERRYLSRCTLTVFAIPFQSAGFYKLQLINDLGDGSFTIEISYDSFYNKIMNTK